MIKKENDYELLYYYRLQEDYVLERLRQQYKPFAWKVVNVCLSTSAQCQGYREDLIDEAVLSLLDAIEAYRDSVACSFSSFYYVCALRKVKTILRHYLRESNYLNLYATSLDSLVKEEEGTYWSDLCKDPNILSDPAMSLRYYEGVKRVLKEVSQLNEEDRKTLSLYQQGYSYQEAAKILGCSTKTYDNRIQKVKRFIKQSIDEQ